MIRSVFPQQPLCTAAERRRRRAAFPLSAVAIIVMCIAPFVPIALAQTPSAPEPQTDESSVAPVVVPATIQALFVTDLYAKDSGYVSQVNNDIGDHVKKGEVLAVLEDPELQAQFDKAQAAVQQAKSALEVAKRQLVGAQADLALQQVTLRRQKELFAGKAATAQTLDEAQAKEGVSSANLETSKAKITLAEADLEAAKAEAERLEALLQYDKITAPFDGVVTRRLVNPGDLVQAATSTRTAALFTVQEVDTVRVFADVPEASAAGVRPGVATEVKLYGIAGVTLRGTVTRIAAALDPATRTMQVEIDLPNPDEKLLPGMYAQATLGAEPPQADSQARRLTARPRG
jgi:multidrug efflux pump subunit AcrA (membrane-fusion protein)